MINIDPEKLDDTFYRYKMPAVQIKIEGSGNGIKTVIPNIHDVCERLNRPEEILIRFFGNKLGAQSTIIKTDDKFLVMGQFPQTRIQEEVYEFIKKYILCRSCRNPETDVIVESKRKIASLKCNSCGKISSLDPGDKTYNFFTLYYTNNKAAPEKPHAAPATAALTKDESGKPHAGTANSPTMAVPPVVAAAKIESTAEEKENPVDILARIIHSGSTPFDTIVGKVFQLKIDYNLKDANVVRLLYRAIISEAEKATPCRFIAAIQAHRQLLQRFTDREEQEKVVVREVQLTCSKHNLHGKFPMAMKLLFEENIVKESTIISWYTTPAVKDVPADVAKSIRDKSESFVKWLQADAVAAEAAEVLPAAQ